jgi:uncharacterized membrane protein
MTAQNRTPTRDSRKSFEQLARELECDEDEEAFKAKVARVANAPKAAKTPKTD